MSDEPAVPSDEPAEPPLTAELVVSANFGERLLESLSDLGTTITETKVAVTEARGDIAHLDETRRRQVVQTFILAVLVIVALGLGIRSQLTSNDVRELTTQIQRDRAQATINACNRDNAARQSTLGIVDLIDASQDAFAQALATLAASGREDDPSAQARVNAALEAIRAQYRKLSEPQRAAVRAGLQPRDCSPAALNVPPPPQDGS